MSKVEQLRETVSACDCIPGAMRGLAAQVAIALALPLAVAKGPEAEALAAAARHREC